jgi:3'-phosphoadenosine 5'-phosphosulfate sulfotransferase (PAPS reductase)/FAD synthetase
VRHEDRWRPVHRWPETKVWEIIEHYSINPHPAYRLGWGRLSCLYCIFGSKNQWATGRQIDPGGFRRVRDYEADFGITIQRNRTPIDMFADMGTVYPDLDPRDIAAAMSETFNEPIILRPGQWRLPKGAFGEQAGPI